MPARHRPGQAHHRRDRPADPPRPPARRRADHQRPPRLLPALVPVAAPPPGPRPMAPLRHPPTGSQHLTKDDRKEVTERNRKPEPCQVTVRDTANSHRETATVLLGPGTRRTRCRAVVPRSGGTGARIVSYQGRPPPPRGRNPVHAVGQRIMPWYAS